MAFILLFTDCLSSYLPKFESNLKEVFSLCLVFEYFSMTLNFWQIILMQPNFIKLLTHKTGTLDLMACFVLTSKVIFSFFFCSNSFLNFILLRCFFFWGDGSHVLSLVLFHCFFFFSFLFNLLFCLPFETRR